MTIGDLASDEPVLMQTDGPASRESTPTTTGDVASVGMALVATDVAALSPTTIGDVSLDGLVPLATDAAASMTSPTNFMGHWLSCLWSSFDFFKNCCRSIFYWLVHVIEIASFYRDWSYDIIHITSKKENDTALDFVLTAISRWKLKKRIENVENTVNELKNSPLLDVSSNNAPNDNANKNRSRIRTASTRKVFGRKVLLDDIMAKLRETPKILGTDSCYSVIGIYGVPGSGKTTFARYTRDYIEQECKEDKLFDTIMCIHLSKTFSVDDVFHEMLKDITNNQHSEISDREELEEKLKESLSGKRFFLILDDLWVTNKNDPQLEELKSMLNAGMKGSKILVTARTKLAAGALCADELIEMPDLDEDEYFRMFMYYAMNGRSDPNEEEFSRVGRVIAEKLHQSPIAAVAVAGRLGANLDIKFWKNTANLGILNNTVNALWWSYQLLNPDIRRCLEMSNIFSRRAKLQRVKLVHMWIAQGFIRTSCETEDMEDVAECYIQELVSCSFLQPEGTCSVSATATECFRIHDLLHDIIEKVAGRHCLIIDNESSLRGGKGYNPEDVHHLLVENYDAELITKMIHGMGNLRTLLIYDDRKDILVEEKFIENLCMRLPKLREFAVTYTGGRTGEPNKFFFPEAISMLKHLRDFVFWIEGPCTVVFPVALTKLHHLRLLNLGASEKVEFTSLDLLNLQHIIWKCMNFPNVGKLTSLQTLSYFIVRNEKGYEVNQLRDLNKLRGKLNISGLENVKSKEEALEANLTAKEGIATLVLEWDGDDTVCSPEVQAEVLEGLCPPTGLETLKLVVTMVRGTHIGWCVRRPVAPITCKDLNYLDGNNRDLVRSSWLSFIFVCYGLPASAGTPYQATWSTSYRSKNFLFISVVVTAMSSGFQHCPSLLRSFILGPAIMS
ncbi:hypothetical protein CFC21_004631 [Triticum aestivum]|uniref:Uncharacterized protein n=2 Tax=Triticum aestivum TaxID=4565 RepID=A0A3B5YPQ9_WHEAT|nr:hypothetical protein CFC21_004631 [Triticum aestivum]